MNRINKFNYRIENKIETFNFKKKKSVVLFDKIDTLFFYSSIYYKSFKQQ